MGDHAKTEEPEEPRKLFKVKVRMTTDHLVLVEASSAFEAEEKAALREKDVNYMILYRDKDPILLSESQRTVSYQAEEFQNRKDGTA